MPLSDERKFAIFPRGKVRDSILLASFRVALRNRANPDTGSLFTEDEIGYITQENSRFFIEADAIDLLGQAMQQRGLWMADQVRPERAASGFLLGFHVPMWLPDGLLPATGGSGSVAATGSPGTIYTGSTIIGDPAAAVARDPAGKRYQVLVTQVANASGQAALQMQAVDTGVGTNPLTGEILTWVASPLGTDPEAAVTSDFTGGFDAETEAEVARRVQRRIQSRPGSGNNAQLREWAEQSSVAVESAFVYACAFHSGSSLVCVLQKRGASVGPLARLASVGTLTSASGYLIPPASPVVPQGNHLVVTTATSVPTDVALKLGLAKGSAGGWVESTPWPSFSAAYPTGVRITTLTSQTSFRFMTDVPLEGLDIGEATAVGAEPALAVWSELTSAFVALDVASVTRVVSNVYDVALSTAPSTALAAGMVVSPACGQSAIIASTVQAYFDELGPGELVENSDPRYVRAARYPRPEQEFAYRAGQNIISRLDDTLGGALSDVSLEYIEQSVPGVPASTATINGPRLLTLGAVGIYST